MTVTTFDTHEFVKRLTGAGFSIEQAEVITDLQKTTSIHTLEQARHDYDLDDLATKRDLKELELTLSIKLAETKAELIRWVIGVVLGIGLLQITIIAGLVFRLSGKL
jgi:hypothetical protein